MTVSTIRVVPEAPASGTAQTAEPTASLRPRLLDLCCGAGGASAGYHAAGFDVIGVDINPQPDYPFPFIQADALTVDLAGFDVVHASPPCQRWSASTPSDRRAGHPDLVAPIRDRLRQAVATSGGPWAYLIENVPGAPLVDPVTICGDTLRLGVRRHRLFESNLPLLGTGCYHDRPTPPVAVYGTYGQRTRRADPGAPEDDRSTDRARQAMGVDWMPWPALTQAIPPAYTMWLGTQLLIHGRDEIRRRLPSPHVQVASVTGDATPSTGKRHAAVLPSPPEPPSSTGYRHCRCGNLLPARSATGRWPRYCSHACRQAAYRDRNRTVGRQP